MIQDAPPLRLLHVTSCCTVGGCEQHVLTLLRRLDGQRYDRWLAYFEEQPDAADVMVDDFRAAGVRTVDLHATGRNDPGAFWRLGALLRKQRFQIVHAHSLRAEAALAFWARFVEPRPRLVRSLHNTDPFYDHPVLHRIGGWSAGQMSRIIAISDAVAEFAREKLGASAAPIQRIYYGVDLANYPPPRTEAPRTNRIAIVARLAQQKGYHVLIDAMARVLEAVPNAQLLIIGHEDDLTIAELAAYAHQRGVGQTITFLGFRADISDLLRDVDVFVLPSLWEGFGLVLLEAMALSLPVVASRVGPIPEVVEDQRTGRLVPPGDSAALADALVSLLRNPALAFGMGLAGRARVSERFSLDAMVSQIEALYRELAPTPAPEQAA